LICHASVCKFAYYFNESKSNDMAKVWIPGYTKSDGTKVKGHYRSAGSGAARDAKAEAKSYSYAGLTRKQKNQLANRVRMENEREAIKNPGYALSSPAQVAGQRLGSSMFKRNMKRALRGK